MGRFALVGLADRDYMRGTTNSRTTARVGRATFAAVAVSHGATLAFDVAGVREYVPLSRNRQEQAPATAARAVPWTNDDLGRLEEARVASTKADRALATEVRRAAALGVPLQLIRQSTGLSRKQIFRIMSE